MKQALLIVCVVGMIAGCKSKHDKEDCVDPPKASASAEGAAPASGDKTVKKISMSMDDVMWCRACVLGPHGFMSCQRVNQENTGETVAQLRERARLAACKDSGFTETKCPADKVISLVCKGDPPPKDKRAAGEALLKALKNGSGTLVLTEDGKRLEKAKPKAGAPTSKASAAAPAAEKEASSPEAPEPKKEKSQ